MQQLTANVFAETGLQKKSRRSSAIKLTDGSMQIPLLGSPSRNDSRKGAKCAKGSLSFRPKGEIFLRSLTFVRDDGAWPVT